MQLAELNLLKNYPDKLLEGAVIDRTTIEFLEQKRPELEAYQSHQNALQLARSRHDSLQEGIQYQKQFNEAITARVKFAQTADYAGSIVRGVRAYAGGIAGIHVVAEQFSGDCMLSLLGDKILAAIEKELADRVSAFEAFKQENVALLKQLKLV